MIPAEGVPGGNPTGFLACAPSVYRGAMSNAIVAALLVVVALAGCGGSGSGSSRAESAVRDAFEQSSDLGTLESVSCEESETPEPATEVEIALYDCQVTTSEDGESTWCLVDSPAGMGPFPLSCESALSEF
jgi:hypothetical protein